MNSELLLTILITVVSGKNTMRRCLKALCPQVDFSEMEIIVPFDKWSEEIKELAVEFPEVRFHFIKDAAIAAQKNIRAGDHLLYDLRRTVGLKLSRGNLIAITEDRAEPAEDWVQQIRFLHQQPFEVIGGAIENGIDKPLNWAWYYCDFGRYGRPFENEEINYISDINVAYKRDALFAIFDVWDERYQETTVHWALKSRGIKLVLDDKMVVYQKRPPMTIKEALHERVEWGRVFAETRVKEINVLPRLLYIWGTPVLPVLLTARVVKHMFRQKRTVRQMISILPIAFLLLLGWSFGELIGYVKGAKQIESDNLEEPFVETI